MAALGCTWAAGFPTVRLVFVLHPKTSGALGRRILGPESSMVLTYKLSLDLSAFLCTHWKREPCREVKGLMPSSAELKPSLGCSGCLSLQLPRLQVIAREAPCGPERISALGTAGSSWVHMAVSSTPPLPCLLLH